jgi:hypothetical protein
MKIKLQLNYILDFMENSGVEVLLVLYSKMVMELLYLSMKGLEMEKTQAEIYFMALVFHYSLE